jgi:hypothetical protein
MMNSVFAGLALGGFLLALVSHVASLWGIDVQSQVPAVWLLHLGVFIVFIPMVFQLRSTNSKEDRYAMFRGLPGWAGAAIALLMAYAVLNFFLAFSGAADGSPAIQNGAFVLQQKGRLVREISEAEYHARQATVLRGFSGHWLIFYFVPFTHFALRKNIAASEAADA